VLSSKPSVEQGLPSVPRCEKIGTVDQLGNRKIENRHWFAKVGSLECVLH